MNKEQLIELYKNESSAVLERLPTQKIVNFIDIIFEAYDNEKSVYAAGNGGNVASVQNLAVDLNMHPFVSDDKNSQTIKRNAFKCVNLCSDQATITGVSNDLGFQYIFSEQLKYQGKEGDVFLGMSGSGNSANILEVMKLAVQKKMKTILVTRNEENKCNEYANLTLSLNGVSEFPGQTGGNNNNFHYEDVLSKITHMAVGLLKHKVQND